MVHQRIKDMIFQFMRPLARLNHLRYRLLPLRRRGGTGALHIGCGPKYLEGFVNIDINPRRRCDMWLDVRNGLPLPDGSVSLIYTVHTLEHFYPDELSDILRECRRVLMVGGTMRIVVPNLGSAIRAYISGHVEWFMDWPRSYRSLGGRFSNAIFCDGQHRLGLDFGFLKELLIASGFSTVVDARPSESRACPSSAMSVCEDELTPTCPRSLYVEAV